MDASLPRERIKGDGSLDRSAPNLLSHVATASGDTRADAETEQDRGLDADQRKQPHDRRSDEHRANTGDERRGEMMDSIDEPKLRLYE